jgi:hypothetical protein
VPEQLTLAPGARDARERFETLAQKLLSEDLGDQLEGHAYEQIVVLLAFFCAAFGVPTGEARGDENAPTAAGRVGLARMLAYAWSPRRVVDGARIGGRGFRPSAVVHGLTRALDLCQAFPTEGLLAELISGGDAANFPGGMLAGQESRAPTPPSDGAIAGRYLAEQLALDSERKGLDPDSTTSDGLFWERIAKVKALMGPEWGAVPDQPELSEQERRDRYAAAARVDEAGIDPDQCPV